MNYHLVGGWKYLTDATGEFFHDLTDIRAAYQRLKANENKYQPRKYIDDTTGDNNSGLLSLSSLSLLLYIIRCCITAFLFLHPFTKKKIDMQFFSFPSLLEAAGFQ